ncbi:MAG: valine--tRNA ligase [Candidatus Saccharimonadales bacterium]
MKLSKVYDPSQYESDIYNLWEKAEAFKPSGEGQSYGLAVPPPNANSNLHVGQALMLSLEDVAVRYHRLKGERTLFVPGADHAGFETWVVYEKKLEQEGKSRFDFKREELYAQVWKFVAHNRENFEQQFRRLGASVDWQHFSFTLDEGIVNQAYATFRQMWQEGLVYRSERLVNFCTFHGTAFADIEVTYKPEKGKLWYIRYPLTEGGGEITIATTRPETMLGDTGVAVHPNDERYRQFIGKTIRLPLTGREIPIVSDSFVDPAYGTGAVKLTPAHDPTDYEAAARHNLPIVRVIDHEGKIIGDMPEAYRKLTTMQARAKVVADLQTQGLVVKDEDIKHNVGHCYKCNTVIEMMPREQWFVDMKPLAAKAIEALLAGKITFYPAAKRTQLIAYLQNLKDWNISRQIAWGIPIPAFQNVNDPDDWIYNEHIMEELILVKGKTYRRDPDVFDTWFSSSSWPYAALGYPGSQDFKDFYPLNVLETGFDTLMQWVSRMLMLGLYVTGEVPFATVYLHGMVTDTRGQKMSKSKGNVINPMDLVDQYGADALRLGLIADRTAGNSQPFSSDKVISGRNFCNKLWNSARYIEGVVGEDFKKGEQPKLQAIADHWILKRLQQAGDTIAGHMDNYRFNEAYESLYHFVWNDFADWYIEASKVKPNPELLAYVLESVLKLAHPFAPFITETIWQVLGWEANTLIAIKRWPETPFGNEEAIKQFVEIKNIIVEVRYLVARLKLVKTKLHYIAPEFVQQNSGLIERLTHVQTVTEVQMTPGLRLINTPYQCRLDVDNKRLQSYIRDIKTQLKAQRAVVFKLQARLINPGYVAKAPAELIEQTRQQLIQAQEVMDTLTQEKNRFEPQQGITKPSQTKPTAPDGHDNSGAQPEESKSKPADPNPESPGNIAETETPAKK